MATPGPNLSSGHVKRSRLMDLTVARKRLERLLDEGVTELQVEDSLEGNDDEDDDDSDFMLSSQCTNTSRRHSECRHRTLRVSQFRL